MIEKFLHHVKGDCFIDASVLLSPTDLLNSLHKPYVIVCGDIGVGKSAYIRGMIPNTPSIQYVEIHRYSSLPRIIRQNAHHVVTIKSAVYPLENDKFEYPYIDTQPIGGNKNETI